VVAASGCNFEVALSTTATSISKRWHHALAVYVSERNCSLVGRALLLVVCRYEFVFQPFRVLYFE
jgi:hypothetical protein